MQNVCVLYPSIPTLSHPYIRLSMHPHIPTCMCSSFCLSINPPDCLHDMSSILSRIHPLIYPSVLLPFMFVFAHSFIGLFIHQFINQHTHPVHHSSVPLLPVFWARDESEFLNSIKSYLKNSIWASMVFSCSNISAVCGCFLLEKQLHSRFHPVCDNILIICKETYN